MPGGIGRRLGAVGGAGPIEDASHVITHRPEADEQLLGDLPIGLPVGDEA